MKQSINQAGLLLVVKRISKHLLFIGVVGFLLLYIYIALVTNSLSSAEPSADELAEYATSGTSTVTIDDKVAETMQSLEDRNTRVQALFNEARENPFNE